MRISHQLVPPGGWMFEVGTIKFKEPTFDILVKTVITFQKVNDLPISTVEDIEDYIADRNPEIIINGEKIKKKSMGVSFYQTVQSFVQFLLNWYLKGGQLVDQNTANVRASICVPCHSNKPSTETRAKTCCGGAKIAKTILAATRAKIIQTRSTPSDAKLLTCEHCGCDNRISVWIPNAILLKPDEANAYPSFCYKKAILEGRDL